jgi:hypothetical protein
LATKTGGGYIRAASGMEAMQLSDSDGQDEYAKRLLKVMVRYIRCDGRRVRVYKVLRVEQIMAIRVIHRNKGIGGSGQEE